MSRLAALVSRFGREAVAFQALEPGLEAWHDGERGVAYADTGGAWVAAGPPLAAAADVGASARAFLQAARAAGRRACFFHVEQPLPGLAHLTLGELPSWDPQRWPERLRSARSLREQLRRARAKGVRVRRLEAAQLRDPRSRDRAQLEALRRAWLDARSLPPMGFLVTLELCAHAEQRCVLVAERDGRMLACLGAIPVPARGGWFIEDLLRGPDAPNGSIELLIDAAMTQFAAEGVRWVTLGLAPLAGDPHPCLRLARRLGEPLYRFEGLHRFKAKLQPDAWQPVYLAYPRGTPWPLALLDALAAFAPGGLLAFGLRTLARWLGRWPAYRALRGRLRAALPPAPQAGDEVSSRDSTSP